MADVGEEMRAAFPNLYRSPSQQAPHAQRGHDVSGPTFSTGHLPSTSAAAAGEASAQAHSLHVATCEPESGQVNSL